MRFKARPRVVSKNAVKTALYRDMIRHPYEDPLIYQERTLCLDNPKQLNDFAVTGGIFNLDFSPDS